MFRRLIITFLLLGAISGLVGCGRDSPTAPAYNRLVYAAMGASDAVGIGAFPPREKGYVYRIRDGLKKRAARVDLHNLGENGKRISYFESTELPAALACQPDVITIWAGPNDVIHGVTPEAFEQALQCILAQLRQATTAIIVIANVPDMTRIPMFLIFPDDDVTKSRILAFNAAIQRQAAAYHVPVVDLYGGGYATDWEYVSIDGFHPSNAGHARIAELFLDILRDAL